MVTHVLYGSNLELIYKPGSPMAQIVESSSLNSYRYTPYSLVWNVHLQAANFVWYSTLHQVCFPARYNREEFILSDGAPIAIDWF